MDDAKPSNTMDHVAATEPKPVPCYAPQVESLTHDLIGQIADKWTMIVFEELAERGTMRFSELRKVYPVIPPRVECCRTDLGRSLGPAVCSLWTWVEQNAETISTAQANFDKIHRFDHFAQ